MKGNPVAGCLCSTCHLLKKISGTHVSKYLSERPATRLASSRVQVRLQSVVVSGFVIRVRGILKSASGPVAE